MRFETVLAVMWLVGVSAKQAVTHRPVLMQQETQRSARVTPAALKAGYSRDGRG